MKRKELGDFIDEQLDFTAMAQVYGGEDPPPGSENDPGEPWPP